MLSLLQLGNIPYHYVISKKTTFVHSCWKTNEIFKQIIYSTVFAALYMV